MKILTSANHKYLVKLGADFSIRYLSTIISVEIKLHGLRFNEQHASETALFLKRITTGGKKGLYMIIWCKTKFEINTRGRLNKQQSAISMHKKLCLVEHQNYFFLQISFIKS